MITGINESKTLAKHICKYNVDLMEKNVIQWCECINIHVFEKDHVWSRATYNCANGEYLASIMDDVVIICDEIIYAEEKTQWKNITCKTPNFYILLVFLLITITLIAVSITSEKWTILEQIKCK